MSVLSLVVDPEFLKLSPQDQRATLSQLDPEFGKLRQQDFSATLAELQKRAISNPGAVAPPSISAPKPEMETSTLGSAYGAMTQDGTDQPQGSPMPSRFSGAAPMAERVDQTVQDTEKNNSLSATGIAYGGFKGALDTAGNTANLVSKVTGNGEFEAPKDPEAMKQHGFSEHVGGIGETVAEFMLGDAALKGMQIGAKLGLVSKVAKLAEESPYIAKILSIGMDSMRMGAVGTGQALAHGEDAGTALKEGAVVGATGGAIEGAAAGIKGLYNVVKGAGGLKSIISEGAAAEAGQGALKTGIRDAGAEVAAAEGVTPEASPSIRSAVENTADSVYGKSKELFSKVDAATGNRFQPIENRMREIQREIRSATTDEEVGKLTSERIKLEAEQEKVFADAMQNGVDKSTVNQARAAYKKSSALFDLNKQIQMTTEGVRPELQVKGSTPETVDPKSLLKRLNKMYDSGRLQEALGDTGAKKLINDVDKAAQSKVARVHTAQLLKRIAIYGGLPLVGSALGATGATHVIKHFID